MPKTYASREVPNIRLVFFNNGTQVRVIDIETIVDYIEDIETNTELNSVQIYFATIDTDDFDFIESKQYTEILLYRCLIMRSCDNGEDELYFPPTLTFHKLNFEYNLNAEGDPTRWIIRLSN